MLYRKLRELAKSLKAKTNYLEKNMRVLNATTGWNNRMNNESLDKVALVMGATSGVDKAGRITDATYSIDGGQINACVR